MIDFACEYQDDDDDDGYDDDDDDDDDDDNDDFNNGDDGDDDDDGLYLCIDFIGEVVNGGATWIRVKCKRNVQRFPLLLKLLFVLKFHFT